MKMINLIGKDFGLLILFLGRLMGRHKLSIPNFYNFIERYIDPHQREITIILASIAESAHGETPGSVMKQIIKKIIDRFISERSTTQFITMGINTIREVKLLLFGI